MLLFLLGFLTGLIVATLVTILTLILYSRSQQILTRYIDRAVENKEKAQFYEPISAEEQIDNLFNIK